MLNIDLRNPSCTCKKIGPAYFVIAEGPKEADIGQKCLPAEPQYTAAVFFRKFFDLKIPNFFQFTVVIRF